MTVELENPGADATYRFAVQKAYTEYLRQENRRTTDAAALAFATKAAQEKIAFGSGWSAWHIFMVVTGRPIPPLRKLAKGAEPPEDTALAVYAYLDGK